MKDDKNFLKMHPKDVQAQIEHCEKQIHSYEILKDSWQNVLNMFYQTQFAGNKT